MSTSVRTVILMRADAFSGSSNGNTNGNGYVNGSVRGNANGILMEIVIVTGWYYHSRKCEWVCNASCDTNGKS